MISSIPAPFAVSGKSFVNVDLPDQECLLHAA